MGDRSFTHIPRPTTEGVSGAVRRKEGVSRPLPYRLNTDNPLPITRA
jgi:hypothetical protein